MMLDGKKNDQIFMIKNQKKKKKCARCDSFHTELTFNTLHRLNYGSICIEDYTCKVLKQVGKCRQVHSCDTVLFSCKKRKPLTTINTISTIGMLEV